MQTMKKGFSQTTASRRAACSRQPFVCRAQASQPSSSVRACAAAVATLATLAAPAAHAAQPLQQLAEMDGSMALAVSGGAAIVGALHIVVW